MAPDPFRYFRVEAPELLDQLGKAVLELEKGNSTDAVGKILRLAHTLKGAARVVKQRTIADKAHAIEGELLPYRDASQTLSRGVIDTILKLLDEISAQVSAIASPTEPLAVPRPRQEETVRTVRTNVAEMDALLDGITETHGQLGVLRTSAEALERARQLAEFLTDQMAVSRAHQGTQSVNGSGQLRWLSVAEELRAMLTGIERGIVGGVQRIDRELRQVRDTAEQLRLVPVEVLFTSLERTTRDAAQMLGKRVTFEGLGGDVRLDAHVLSAVQGALTQLVRNAVAHGIETEDLRKLRRKPLVGRVQLNVARRGRWVVFTCIDDGVGIDIDAVRRTAQANGLLDANLANMAPDALMRLLMKGGISTARTVTEVSGRGVGLDVVREVAERLGGSVDVRTASGSGTTVELVVPLSLASLEGLAIEVAGITVTMPLDAVVRALRLRADEIVQTPDGATIVYDGKVMPFLPLSRLLAVKQKAPNGPQATSAVVVSGENRMAAIGIDRMLRTENIVFRPLPSLAPASSVVAGVSLDAEGNPQIVLDPEVLVAEAMRCSVLVPEPEQSRPPVLVIDDSLTTRMLEQSILESAGFEVDVAVSAEEGLNEARRKRYRLFLTDIEMPGMDGFTFIERIRADPILRDIPAILVSSRASQEDQQRGEAVGAQGYIVKSEFDQGEFLARVRQLVS